MTVELRILGPLEVSIDGAQVAVAGARRRALLLRLLVAGGRVVSTERLAEDLWDGNPPPSADGTLQSHVSHLRKALGHHRLVTGAGGYGLSFDGAELDAALFEGEVAMARTAAPAEAVDTLKRALDRWRGDALADVRSSPWALAEAIRLDELRWEALEVLLRSRLRLGQHNAVVGAAEAAVAEQPLRERLWAVLIEALYGAGRQGDALAAYQRVRAALRDELGVDPSPELRQLESRVLAQSSELSEQVPPAATAAGLPTGVVTFLLSDVVGSTRLWESQPAAMAEALRRHDEVIDSAVGRHGGRVLKGRGEGDSTFNVFSRATDAASAALEIQTALAQSTWPPGCEIRVRMAIHTGEALERGGDYYGRAVNRAARLRSSAQPSQILVSSASAELILDHLATDAELRPLGQQQLADLQRPEDVYDLAPRGRALNRWDRGEAAHTGAGVTAPLVLPRQLAAARSVFIGRQAQLAILEQCAHDAANGTPRFALVAGEPGIGKTALVAEVAGRAHDSGSVVVLGRCEELVRIPYQPFVDALGSLLSRPSPDLIRSIGDRALAELTRLVPEALDHRGYSLPPPQETDPETQRYLLMNAVVRTLAQGAADRAVVVVLEDLHWADEATLLLLRHLVTTIPDAQLLVLATLRSTEVAMNRALAELVAALHREPSVVSIRLEGLDEHDVVALTGVDPETAAALQRETGGNPFYAKEVVTHFQQTGEWAAPQSIRDVTAHRVGLLGTDVADILGAASVVGEEFDLDVVTAALDRSDEEVLAVLERAEQSALVTMPLPGRFGFVHALVRRALYDGIPATRRSRLHRAVALALARDSAAAPAEVARHWLLAGDRSAARHWAIVAGDHAISRRAPHEAVRWYAEALALTPSADIEHGPRCDVLIALGEAQRQSGDQEFRDTLQEAAELALDADDAGRLVRAVLVSDDGEGSAFLPDGRRLRVLRAAAEAAGETDPGTRASVMVMLADELIFAHGAESRTLYAGARQIAQRLGDPDVLLRVLSHTAPAIYPEELDRFRAESDEVVALADEGDDPAIAFQAWAMRVIIGWQSGDIVVVDEALARLAALADETSQPWHRWRTTYSQSVRELVRGDLEAAERLMEDAYRFGLEGRRSHALPIYIGQLYQLRIQQGRRQEAVTKVTEARSQYDITPFRMVSGAGGLQDLTADGGWMVSLVQLGLRSIAEGDRALAQRVYERLLPAREQVAQGVAVVAGPAAHYLARLARMLGDDEAALRHAAEADVVSGRLGAPFFRARNWLEWSDILLARRDERDHEAAATMLQGAMDLSARFGFPTIESRAFQRLDRLG